MSGTCMVCENQVCALRRRLFEEEILEDSHSLWCCLDMAFGRYCSDAEFKELVALTNPELMKEHRLTETNQRDIIRLRSYLDSSIHTTIDELLFCRKQCKPTSIYFVSPAPHHKEYVVLLLRYLFDVNDVVDHVIVPYLGPCYSLVLWRQTLVEGSWICQECLPSFIEQPPFPNVFISERRS